MKFDELRKIANDLSLTYLSSEQQLHILRMIEDDNEAILTVMARLNRNPRLVSTFSILLRAMLEADASKLYHLAALTSSGKLMGNSSMLESAIDAVNGCSSRTAPYLLEVVLNETIMKQAAYYGYALTVVVALDQQYRMGSFSDDNENYKITGAMLLNETYIRHHKADMIEFIANPVMINAKQDIYQDSLTQVRNCIYGDLRRKIMQVAGNEKLLELGKDVRADAIKLLERSNPEASAIISDTLCNPNLLAQRDKYLLSLRELTELRLANIEFIEKLCGAMVDKRNLRKDDLSFIQEIDKILGRDQHEVDTKTMTTEDYKAFLVPDRGRKRTLVQRLQDKIPYIH